MSKRPSDTLGSERESKKGRSLLDQSFDELICPITHEFPLEAVTAEDGRVYERIAIEAWLKKKTTSPVTNRHMGVKLLPALHVKNLLRSLVMNGALVGDRAEEYRKRILEKDMIQETKTKAEQGDINAADDLSTWYSYGAHGVVADKVLSHRYGLMAVNSPHPSTNAMINIAEDYLHGRGTKRNITLAMHYMTKAADNSSKFALVQLGKIFLAMKEESLARLYFSSIYRKTIFEDIDESNKEFAIKWLQQHPANVTTAKLSGLELKNRIVDSVLSLTNVSSQNLQPDQANAHGVTIEKVSSVFKATPFGDIVGSLEELVREGHVKKDGNRYWC